MSRDITRWYINWQLLSVIYQNFCFNHEIHLKIHIRNFGNCKNIVDECIFIEQNVLDNSSESLMNDLSVNRSSTQTGANDQ